jgi:hypothetical protein
MSDSDLRRSLANLITGELFSPTTSPMECTNRRVIERVYGDRLPEHFERLADHAVRGDCRRKPSATSVRERAERELRQASVDFGAAL